MNGVSIHSYCPNDVLYILLQLSSEAPKVIDLFSPSLHVDYGLLITVVESGVLFCVSV